MKLLMGAGVGVVVLGITVLFAMIGKGIGQEPVAAGTAFLSDCAAKKYQPAYDRLSADVRGRLSLRQFEATVEEHAALHSYRSFVRRHTSAGTSKAHFEGTFEFEGGTTKGQVHLVKEDGSWKVSGLVINGLDVLVPPER
jgi:hypothetical protein